MGELSELISRLEKAEGPDREIDAWIGYHTDLAVEGMSWRAKIDRFGIDHAMKAATSDSNIWSTSLPPYTASLDATVALIERVLPGWGWQIGPFPKMRAQLAEPIQTNYGPGVGVRGQSTGPTAPIALLLALLRAKEAGR